MIPFSKPFYSENCINTIKDSFKNEISYIKKCEQVIISKYNFNHVILTTSCTHSLEMMCMVLDIKYGDEVLVPSYTFVSTANAFVKFGAVIKCIDSYKNNPNIDTTKIEEAITEKTKALVIVHYAGWSCDMDKIVEICSRRKIFLLEDAAQAINSYYKGKALGTFGKLSAFSFHSTKNINCGEGGMLVINDKSLINKAHIICDKGTNRYDFLNNIVDKYEWIGKGSSYSMGEINAAYLYPQLVNIDSIIKKRREIWYNYKKKLEFIEEKNLGKLCEEVKNCKGNYHIFYILFDDEMMLKNVKNELKRNNVIATSHYRPLHASEFYMKNYGHIELKNAEKFGDKLLRLPLHHDLTMQDCNKICSFINDYCNYEIKKYIHGELKKNITNDIIKLKTQFWKHTHESQIKWLDNNVRNNDTHLLLYNNKELIGYTLIMNRNCKIIDSVIVNKNYRGHGYGGILIKYLIDIIGENGFLLCEKQNIDFYKKFGWVQDDNIDVDDKNIKNNLFKMCYKLKLKKNIIFYK